MTTQTPDAVREDLTSHPCWREGLNRLSHRHWSARGEWQPTCERCGTPIDRQHNETGPVCWTAPVNPHTVLAPLWNEIGRVHATAMSKGVSPDEYRALMLAALNSRAGDAGEAISALRALLVIAGTPITERQEAIFRRANAIAFPTPAPAIAAVPAGEVEQAGQFLLDRLVDHEVRMTSDADAREWHGHVTPAMARFRASLSHGEGRK